MSDARRSGRTLTLAAVAALAFLTRLIPVLTGGGFGFYGRYDDGVYYAASDSFTFGRMPYRDFVLLHPPGLMIALTPFALLGRLTTDATGMAVARGCFMLLGALNAVLIATLAGRWSRRAGIAAGLVYAVLIPVVYSEQTTMLEPLGNTAVLAALLLILKRIPAVSVRAQLLAGVALGIACTMKIYYVAPLFGVVVCQLLARRWRSTQRIVLGAAAALVVVLGPFLAIARWRMFDMVVRDQLLRSEVVTGRSWRIASIVGIRQLFLHSAARPALAGVLVGVIVLAALAIVRDADARVIVVLLIVNAIVLIAAPSYFEHYAALTAAPAALVLGIGVDRILAGRVLRVLSPGPQVLLAAAVVVYGIAAMTHPTGKRFPQHALSRALPPGCITSDDPQALIQLNRLSSDLRTGCRVSVDVTGLTYDTLHRTGPDGQSIARHDNPAWQAWIQDYLSSGSAFVILRADRDGFDDEVSRALHELPVLAIAHGLVLHAGNGTAVP